MNDDLKNKPNCNGHNKSLFILYRICISLIISILFLSLLAPKPRKSDDPMLDEPPPNRLTNKNVNNFNDHIP
jgi:hypothetical protein